MTRGADYEAARDSSAGRLSNTKPSLSVRTMSCFPHRLMMRMDVSIVVPIMSASSCRDSARGMNVPSRDAAAHLVGELQEKTREAAFDAAAGKLGQTVGQFHQPMCEADQEAANQRRDASRAARRTPAAEWRDRWWVRSPRALAG